jgi:hypothetical protein
MGQGGFIPIEIERTGPAIAEEAKRIATPGHDYQGSVGRCRTPFGGAH